MTPHRNKTKILICGRNREIVDQAKYVLEDLKGPSMLKVIFDPLSVISEPYLACLAEHAPDIVLLTLDRNSEDDLEVLSTLPVTQRPPRLILIHSEIEAPINLRLAMKSGALDVFPIPKEARELADLLNQTDREIKSQSSHGARITLIMSVTGGGGASNLAAGLAAYCAGQLKEKTLLLDLDIQFGTQYLRHDKTPEKGLREAVQQAGSLDQTALHGLVTPHELGFDLIGIHPDQFCIESDLPIEDLETFVDIAKDAYDGIIVDHPCQIGNVLSQLLPQSTQILLVVTQDLASIKNTLKLIQILVTDLEQSPEKIGYVVNKYQSQHAIRLSDIDKALNIECFGSIPLDTQTIEGATSHGTPLLKHSPKAKSTLAISGIGQRLAGQPTPRPSLSPVLQRLAHFWNEK